MRKHHLLLILLLVILFGMSASLSTQFEAMQTQRPESANPLVTMLGESRRLFADHFFVKADKYFHSGYYPTMFDDQTAFHTPHMALYPNVINPDKPAPAPKKSWFKNVVDVNDESGSPGQSRDWVDEFGRNFYPVRHTHLDQQGEKGDMRELLPWLKLAAEMDPHRVETYVVTAFWLRTELGRADEAEQFLREGLRANPKNPEMLFELGRIYREHRHEAARARQVWELAVAHWHETEAAKPEPNIFILAQLTGQLATLEEEAARYPAALQHLQALHTVSPNGPAIQKWIGDVWGKLAAVENAHAIAPL